jgi:chromosome segregation ATPase
MILEVGLWDFVTVAVTLLLAFLGGVAGVARYSLAQMDKRLDQRFEAQEEARKKEMQRVDEQLGSLSGQIAKQERAREAGKQHWDDQFAEIDRRLSDHRERISRLEVAADAAPSHEHLADLHERINGIAEDVSSLSGEFKGAKHTLELIHSFLLNGGKS